MESALHARTRREERCGRALPHACASSVSLPFISFAIHDQSGPGMISRLPRDLLAKPAQVFTPYDGEIFDEPDAYFEFQLHVPTEGGAEPPQGEVDS
jgi:hypothetical protein